MKTDFFKNYKKIINAKSLLNKSIELGEKGEIEYPFVNKTTLSSKINGRLDKLTVAELKDLAYTLKKAGITGGHKSLDGQHIYQDLDIIKFKPFMEFALLPEATWEKVKNEVPLTADEKDTRSEIRNIVQVIYEGREIDPEKRRTLAKAMNKIARDL